MPIEYVTITHPEYGESEVIESSLPVWEERGWKRAPESSKSAKAAKQQAKTTHPNS